MRFAQAYTKADLLAKLPPTNELDEGGKKFLSLMPAIAACLYFPDDKTIIVGHESILRHMITAQNVDTPLAKLLGKTDCSGTLTSAVVVEPLRPLLTQSLATMSMMLPALSQVQAVLPKLEAVVFRLQIGANSEFGLTLRGTDAAAAGEIETAFQQLLDATQPGKVSRLPPSDDPVQQAYQRYAARISKRQNDTYKPVRNGADVTFTYRDDGSFAVIGAGIGMAVVLPAVQAARNAAERQRQLNQQGH